MIVPVSPGDVILHNLSWYYLQEQIKRVKPDNSNKRTSSAKEGAKSSRSPWTIFSIESDGSRLMNCGLRDASVLLMAASAQQNKKYKQSVYTENKNLWCYCLTECSRKLEVRQDLLLSGNSVKKNLQASGQTAIPLYTKINLSLFLATTVHYKDSNSPVLKYQISSDSKKTTNSINIAVASFQEYR